MCRIPGRQAWVQFLARVTVLCLWARCFTFTLPLFTQVYKWVPELLGKPNMLGGNLRWTSIPSRGSSDAPSRFILWKPDLSTGSMSLRARNGLYLYLPDWISPYQVDKSHKKELNIQWIYLDDNNNKYLFP